MVLLDSLLVEAADEVSEEVEMLLLKPESLDLALVALTVALSSPLTVVSSSLEIAEDTSAASMEASDMVEAPCGSLVETAAVAVAFALEVLAAAAVARGEGGSIFILVEEGTVSAEKQTVWKFENFSTTHRFLCEIKFSNSDLKTFILIVSEALAKVLQINFTLKI